MTATEELRRMLDERGVEYTDRDMFGKHVFHWGTPMVNGAMFTDAGEWTELVVENASLEQAIAATLGPAYEPPVAAHWDGDTLTLTIPRDPSCIRVQRSTEQPCKVYADESKVIAATLGRGECHDKGNIERFICSECGCRLIMQDDDWEPTMLVDGVADVPKYCPNCGRKVVDA